MICNWKQHFDIQRFAGAGTQTTGTSTLSAEMKTFYDKTLLDNAEPQLVHDQFGQERNIPAHGGKTIEFRKFSSLAKATTALTEGVTPDGKSLTVTSKTATVASGDKCRAIRWSLPPLTTPLWRRRGFWATRRAAPWTP